MTPLALTFTDTETISLHRETRLAWEIAMVRREPDGTETEAEFFIADVDLTHADPQSLKFGRFHERYRQQHDDRSDADGEYLPEFSAARKVEQMTRGAMLLGGNPAFDDLHLDRLLRRYGLCPSWHYHPWDVTAYVAGALGVPAGAGLKSDDISRMIGVDPDAFDRHTAMGDVRWLMAQYQAVLALRGSESWQSYDPLANIG
ncbi:hypothetical protein Drose_05740 [Dactylosporangium roseum]|uniref:Exonuclease domain-containing protein n=1 Tax=Dactylosporangium roseum TaxID=47989 RepID=A0ABY5Z7F3_9ACTN|nr:hypothetical protein [Dactylosporangium roseum]UWZ37772.1 hypothetical protein Drose_05740 [Dactylosporangium roseum]